MDASLAQFYADTVGALLKNQDVPLNDLIDAAGIRLAEFIERDGDQHTTADDREEMKRQLALVLLATANRSLPVHELMYALGDLASHRAKQAQPVQAPAPQAPPTPVSPLDGIVNRRRSPIHPAPGAAPSGADPQAGRGYPGGAQAMPPASAPAPMPYPPHVPSGDPYAPQAHGSYAGQAPDDADSAHDGADPALAPNNGRDRGRARRRNR